LSANSSSLLRCANQCTHRIMKPRRAPRHVEVEVLAAERTHPVCLRTARDPLATLTGSPRGRAPPRRRVVLARRPVQSLVEAPPRRAPTATPLCWSGEVEQEHPQKLPRDAHPHLSPSAGPAKLSRNTHEAPSEVVIVPALPQRRVRALRRQRRAASAARSVRVRKHSAIERRTWLCGCDCHASVSSRTQCGPTVPSAAYTPPR